MKSGANACWSWMSVPALIAAAGALGSTPEDAIVQGGAGRPETAETRSSGSEIALSSLLDPSPATTFVDGRLVIWNGRAGAELDVRAEEWSILPENPRARSAWDVSVIGLANGHVLAACSSDSGQGDLRIDEYRPRERDWSRRGEIARAALPDRFHDARLSIGGVVELESGIVVLIGLEKVELLVLPPSGGWELQPTENPPEYSWHDSFAYGRGDSVLYGAYTNVTHDTWGLWRFGEDRWSECQEMAPTYDFGHCSTGDEVYVFGGARSSAFGFINESGWIYSFPEAKWRPMRMEGGPGGSRGAAVCWTGKQVFVWGGVAVGEDDSLHGPPVAAPTVPSCYVPRNTGGLFDPIEETWTPVTTEGAPSPRTNSACAWTGHEVVIWGGWRKGERLSDAYAYQPAANRWRPLPSMMTVFGK